MNAKRPVRGGRRRDLIGRARMHKSRAVVTKCHAVRVLRSRRSSLRTWTCRVALALSAIAPRQVFAEPAPAAVRGAEQQACPPGVRLVGDEAAAKAVSA